MLQKLLFMHSFFIYLFVYLFVLFNSLFFNYLFVLVPLQPYPIWSVFAIHALKQRGEKNLDPCQTSAMEPFAKIVNTWKLFIHVWVLNTPLHKTQNRLKLQNNNKHSLVAAIFNHYHIALVNHWFLAHANYAGKAPTKVTVK